MAVRSFEELVRAELGALRLKPDEQVWLHVEAALHKEKKRRWLIWFFAGLVALGGAAWYYFQQTNDAAGSPIFGETKLPNQTVPAGTTASQQKDIAKEKPGSPSVQQTTTQVSEQAIAKYDNGISAGKNVSRGQAVQTGIATKASASQNNGHVSTQQATVQQVNPSQSETAGNNDPQKTTVVTSIVTPPTTQTKEHTVTKNAAPVAVVDSGVSKPASATETVQVTDSAKENTATNTLITIKPPKKTWRFFGSIDIGGSKEVIPPRFKGFPNATAAPPSNSIPGNSNGMYNNGAVYREPERSGGFSWGLNLQAIKAIGKNTDIGFGLGYQLYQAKISVGRQMYYSQQASSRSGSFFLSSDSVNYTNSWHFAELAIDLYQRISMGGSTVLRWRVGLGSDLLLASNALYYNKSTAVLYEDEETRHKLQFNLSTGFDLGFGRQQVFFIGPQFTYFLTPSTSNSDYHFFRTALRASYAIPKMKRRK